MRISDKSQSIYYQYRDGKISYEELMKQASKLDSKQLSLFDIEKKKRKVKKEIKAL